MDAHTRIRLASRMGTSSRPSTAPIRPRRIDAHPPTHFFTHHHSLPLEIQAPQNARRHRGADMGKRTSMENDASTADDSVVIRSMRPALTVSRAAMASVGWKPLTMTWRRAHPSRFRSPPSCRQSTVMPSCLGMYQWPATDSAHHHCTSNGPLLAPLSRDETSTQKASRQEMP